MKLKKNKGSALTLAIIVIALMTMVVMIISLQINNQIKFNSRQYEDMKYKYMAEAGIEKSIAEVILDIKQKIAFINNTSRNNNQINKAVDHSNHKKLEYIDGKPNVSQFDQMIIRDLIVNNSNDSIGLLMDNLTWYVGLVIGNEKADELKDQYIVTIWNKINIEIWSGGNFKWEESTYDELEQMLNSSILKLEEVYQLVENNPTDPYSAKSNAKNYLNRMKEVIIEIKCRLGMSIDVSEPNPEYNSISINIPNYIVSLNNANGTLNFEGNYTSVQIMVERDTNGKVKNIDLTNLNNKTNSNDDKLTSISGNKKIESKVEFIFTKVTNGYDIKYKINSYE